LHRKVDILQGLQLVLNQRIDQEAHVVNTAISALLKKIQTSLVSLELVLAGKFDRQIQSLSHDNESNARSLHGKVDNLQTLHLALNRRIHQETCSINAAISGGRSKVQMSIVALELVLSSKLDQHIKSLQNMNDTVARTLHREIGTLQTL
jgi:hypothetical protein